MIAMSIHNNDSITPSFHFDSDLYHSPQFINIHNEVSSQKSTFSPALRRKLLILLPPLFISTATCTTLHNLLISITKYHLKRVRSHLPCAEKYSYNYTITIPLPRVLPLPSSVMLLSYRLCFCFVFHKNIVIRIQTFGFLIVQPPTVIVPPHHCRFQVA